MNKPLDDLERLKSEYRARSRRLRNQELYSSLNLSYLFMIQQRQRSKINLLKDVGLTELSDKRILEIGSGKGDVIQEFMFHRINCSQLYGVELLMDRIEIAKDRFPNVNFTLGDAQLLPYPNKQFDIVVQYTVFSSILDTQIRTLIANEMQRVLKEEGIIIWYDFWLNPINPHTHGIRKAEIKELFPNCEMVFRKTTLAPPIARRIVPVSWILAYLLERLSLFNTHYLVVIQPTKS